ncbi:MAG: hypothetical protein Q4D19_06615 [Lautropia sp.]|nr:hypothetical protein [Lautropia sp.]
MNVESGKPGPMSRAGEIPAHEAVPDEVVPKDESENTRSVIDRVDDAANTTGIIMHSVDIVLDLVKSPFDC